jgi:hypothetical protein
MGLLALGLVFNLGGRYVDQSGSLWLLSQAPLGRLIVAAFVIGIGAYALWGFVRAVYDPLNRGDGPQGLPNRLGWAWSGSSYALLTVFALHLTVSAKTNPPGDVVAQLANRLFNLPGGRALAIAAGAIAIGAGLAQFVDAYQARWRKDLKRREMSDTERSSATLLGRFGLIARGVTFIMVGWLLVLAGWTSEPDLAGGYARAFRSLEGGPAGRVTLAVVALGFVALGLHSLANARWIKLATGR